MLLKKVHVGLRLLPFYCVHLSGFFFFLTNENDFPIDVKCKDTGFPIKQTKKMTSELQNNCAINLDLMHPVLNVTQFLFKSL